MFSYAETDHPTMAYMESRLEATVNSSCDLQRDRIIESFIGSVSDLIVTGSLCQPQHRCRVRNTFVYCSAANVTVDFVLETELRTDFRPASEAAQLDPVHALENVYEAMFHLVRDGQLAWSVGDGQVVARVLESARVEYDRENCTVGQVLNVRNQDASTCRAYIPTCSLDRITRPTILMHGFQHYVSVHP